jgi:hypothetical protein
MKSLFKYDINQLRDYSSLFSRCHVLAWLKADFSAVNSTIKRYDKSWLKSERKTYLEYLRHIYSILSSSYQNEYIYKNEYLKQLIINELGHNESTVFSEFRTGDAIADLAMFNGISKVFEIKTEFDSAARLDAQLKSYKKVFNAIYLIIPEAKLSTYQKHDDSIGLITFRPGHSHLFDCYRKAVTNPVVDSAAIMQLLHSNEYKAIAKNYFGRLPEMTSFNQFNTCKELIQNIPSNDLNTLFISEIKKRATSKALSSQKYHELNQLVLALKMNQQAKKKLIDTLQSPIQL